MSKCVNCGNDLPNGANSCPVCGNACNSGVKVCPKCNAEYSNDYTFCSNCGTQLTNPTAQQNFAPNYSKPNYTQPNYNINNVPKSRLVAGLLGLFLGSVGVHSFYLGHTTRGVLQIIVTFITCGVGSLWGFIEGILILCRQINVDAGGMPLKNDC